MAEQPLVEPTDAAGGVAPERAMLVVTPDGWLHDLSPEFAAIVGRPLDETIAQNWLDWVHPDEVGRCRLMVTAAADGAEIAGFDVRIWSAQKDWRDLTVSMRARGEGLVTIDVSVVHRRENLGSAGRPGTTGHSQAVPAPVAESRAVPTSPGDGIGPSTEPSASVPGPQTAGRRSAIRRSVGGGHFPLIEIDTAGRTTHVTGDWASEGVGQLAGIEAFERVLEASGKVDEIGDAIGRTLATAASAVFEISHERNGARFVHVVPIPSPFRDGVTHALVAVTDSMDREAVTEPAPAQQQAVPTSPAFPSPALTVAASPATQAPVAAPSPAAKPDGPQPPITRPTIIDRFEPVQRWASGRGLTMNQLGVAVGVVLIALFLRTWDLGSLPTGFHGDEAITGQEAQRVIDHGSIGVYTGSALGQPTAPYYVWSIAIALFGPTVWATRIVAALAGVLSVAAVYLVVQRRFDHRTAIASAFGLATMTWSITFSRIAFGLAWWPLVVVLAMAAIDRAATDGRRRSWLIAGALTAFGVYVYNSHWSFGIGVAVFMVIWLLWKRRPVNRVTAIVYGPLAALVVIAPIARFALDERNGYFNHFRLLSRRNLPEWTEAGLGGKARLLTDWYFDAWDVLLFKPMPDGVDASGVIKQVPLVFTLLAAVGIIDVLVRRRTAFTGLLLVTLLILPIANSMTVDGLTRRNFALAPVIAILAGFGAVAIIDAISARIGTPAGRTVASGLVVVVLFVSVLPYFTTFRNDGFQKWVFADELTTTVKAVQLAEADGPVFVQFYSGRHYFDYSTLQFLLDGTPGANPTPLDLGFNDNAPFELLDPSDRDHVFVLVGDYANQFDRLRDLYPDGRVILDDNDPRVIAYEVAAP